MKIERILLFICLMIGGLNLRVQSHPPAPDSAAANWPETFEGSILTALPLSGREESFARSFPGAIATFRTSGGSQIIFRRADRATRRLHPSTDCLRAAGYSISEIHTDSGWAVCRARKNGESLLVRGQIRSTQSGETWTDTSAWFWHAGFHPNDGPWLAVTVLERDEGGR